MAIIQISRIQVRRGQKNQGSGLPQLASGELGWAIDARELYIGNGSVSEGSPAVGNTKLLTEHDNIFNLDNTYTYKSGSAIQTGTATSSPITRTLQARLDDTVSVKSFGMTGDASQDVSVALQRAIDQLYLNTGNTGEKSRVTLLFEPGIYVVSNPIYLPPFTTLKGYGAEKTVIRQTGNHTLFHTVSGSAPTVTSGTVNTTASSTTITTTDTSTFAVGAAITGAGIPVNTIVNTIGNTGPNYSIVLSNAATATASNVTVSISHYTIHSSDTANTQARNISISDMTLNTTGTGIGLDLQNCKNSIFKDLIIVGPWVMGASIPTTYNTNIGCRLSSLSSAVSSDTNKFIRCAIKNWAYGMFSGYDIKQNLIIDSEFTENGHAVSFGVNMTLGANGQQIGPQHTRIQNTKFTNIARYGIWVEKGQDNISENNEFNSVGNDGGTEAQPTYPVINFVQDTNRSINDYFSRTENLSYNKHNLTANGTTIMTQIAYKPEISGIFAAEFGQLHNVNLFNAGSPGLAIFRLPYAGRQSYLIEYQVINTNTSIIKRGVLTICVEVDSTPSISVSDEYSYTGDTGNEDAISFAASIHDYNSDATNDTIVVNGINTLSTTSKMQFRIQTIKSS